MGISITYNGISSDSFTLNGKRFLHIMTKPTIPAAVEDVETIRIPGRDNAVVFRDGTYSPIEILVTFSFRLPPSAWYSSLNPVYAWLINKPTTPMFKLSYMSVSYKVLHVRVGELRKVSPNIYQLDATFLCEALPYVDIDASDGPYDLGQTIYPPSATYDAPVSHPLFEFRCSGTGSVGIRTGSGTVVITLYNSPVYMDTDLMIAYYQYGGTRTNFSNYVDGNYSDLWTTNNNTSFYFYKPSDSNINSANLTVYWRERAFV